MTLGEIAKRAERLVADNSPAILTAIGVTGALTAAYLTGKATFKAAEIIRKEEYILGRDEDRMTPLEVKEIVPLIWKLYIPAAGTMVLTISAIIAANRVSNRRTAALASVYAISERAFSEYKDKVFEKFGEKKEQVVRDEIAQEQVNKNPVSTREIIITGGGNVLCYDHYTGRYFESDVETLRKAQNDLNSEILNDGYASLADFYNLINLSSTTVAEQVGWTSDRLMKLKITTVMSEDSRPCIAIDFDVQPIKNYYRIN